MKFCFHSFWRHEHLVDLVTKEEEDEEETVINGLKTVMKRSFFQADVQRTRKNEH